MKAIIGEGSNFSWVLSFSFQKGKRNQELAVDRRAWRLYRKGVTIDDMLKVNPGGKPVDSLKNVTERDR
jgi:hypothetical protein